MMGFLLDTNHDTAGRSKSVFFAGTDNARIVKQCFGTQIDAQIIDLEAMLRMTEIEARVIDWNFRNLHTALAHQPGEGKIDWGCRVFRLIFKWDLGKSWIG